VTAPAPEEQDGNLGVILAALVALLIAGAAFAAFLSLLLRLPGMHVEALRYLLRPYEELGSITLVTERPPPNTGGWSEPQVQQFNQNLRRRSAYIVAAGRRASRAYDEGGIVALREVYEKERLFFRQHVAAQQRRMRAAEAVGSAMEHYSEVLLGWVATLDDRTSGECRQAHGRNFDPSRIPAIGYPGSVHPHCRCRPGPPFATRKRVEGIRPDVRRTA
jgi:hypothetical protein